MQTNQLAENDLKRDKRAGSFIDARAIKFLIIRIGTKMISFRFYFYLKFMPFSLTRKVSKFIQKIRFTSLCFTYITC